MWRYGRGQERKVSVVKSMEARAKRLREALARASETVKLRRMEAVLGRRSQESFTRIAQHSPIYFNIRTHFSLGIAKDRIAFTELIQHF